MVGQSRIGVIGGGILGMKIALDLVKNGYNVTLVEKQPVLGGLADSGVTGKLEWDQFYHVILLSDRHTRSLLRELGLVDEFPVF